MRVGGLSVPSPQTKLHGKALAGPVEQIRVPRDKAGLRETDEDPAERSSAPQHGWRIVETSWDAFRTVVVQFKA